MIWILFSQFIILFHKYWDMPRMPQYIWHIRAYTVQHHSLSWPSFSMWYQLIAYVNKVYVYFHRIDYYCLHIHNNLHVWLRREIFIAGANLWQYVFVILIPGHCIAFIEYYQFASLNLWSTAIKVINWSPMRS